MSGATLGADRISPDCSSRYKFLLIEGRPALFSETQQKLFFLSQPAAYVWCRLEDCIARRDIISELITRGFSSEDASAFFDRIFRAWVKLRLLTIDPKSFRSTEAPGSGRTHG